VSSATVNTLVPRSSYTVNVTSSANSFVNIAWNRQ
jgi:hypothetical protein